MTEPPAKTKAQLKAERRAKQEADRAAKASGAKKGKGGNEKQAGSGEHATTSKEIKKPQTLKASVRANEADESMKKRTGDTGDAPALETPTGVHPAFLKLGLNSSQRTILGSDGLCLALIDAFKELISGFDLPQDKAFGRELEVSIRPHVSFLSGGKPLPPAMGNLVRQLKARMTSLPDDIEKAQGKQILHDWLNDFEETKIKLAIEAISMYTQDKLKEGSTVMTYGWSQVTEKIFMDSASLNLTVIVVDSLPNQNGKILVRRLVGKGIESHYTLVSCLAHIMKECETVVLSSDSILANGDAVTGVGGSLLALAASTHNIPVLVACPTYKFQEKVTAFPGMDTAGSQLYQEALETVPSGLITGIVTELRILPPSSAPAVLRVKQMLT